MSAALPGTPEAGPSRPLLLCLSHLRWGFVFQRPQHLLTRAARSHDVVFFEEAHFEDGPPRLELHPTPEGVTVAVPHLPPSTPDPEAAQRAMLDGLLAERRRPGQRLIAWFYTPMALGFAAHLTPDATVYDCMDELSAFRGAPPEMLQRERDLLAHADLVFTGGRSLFEAKRDRHPRVYCFPSSIDAGHYLAARSGGTDPADQAPIARPRVGFFGVVDERMDLKLTDALAAARPDWQWVMIGPVVKMDPAELPRRPNLHWLGGKSYAELPAYLGGWDAGVMPFALNESTRFISPTKTPEFLAAGLPVASTPVVDVVRDWGPQPDGTSGLVEIAADAPGLVAALEQVMARPRGPWLEGVDRRLALQSWDGTWAEMAALIQGVANPIATSTRTTAHV